MGIYNDNLNANIELTCTGTGQVNINAPVKAESYIASNGAVGVTGVMLPNQALNIVNGIVTQIITP